MSRQGDCHEFERSDGNDPGSAEGSADTATAPKGARRRRFQEDCRRERPTGIAVAVLRLLATGLVAGGVYFADGAGVCADDACGGFESVRPELVGVVLLALQGVHRFLVCLFAKGRRGRGATAAGENDRIEAPEAEAGSAESAEADGEAGVAVGASENEAPVREAPAGGVGERGRRGPTPSEVIAAAHRPDAIVVPPSWCAPVEFIDAMGPGDCGGFDPKAPIIWPDGTLQVPSPCPPGGSEGCLCTALEVWIARARRSLEAEVAPSAPGAETDDEPR